MLPLAGWYLGAQLISLPALAITCLIFPHLPDRGYPLSKVLGLLAVSYLLWLGASLHLLPNTLSSLLLLLGLLYGLAALIVWRRREQFRAFLASHLKLILLTELLFLVGFVSWSLVRAFNPDIRFAESPVDFSMLNAALRARFFPPADPGLSGHPVNYYYFGYVMMGAVARLSGVPPALGYNLALAHLFALTAVAAFSLIYNLVRLAGGSSRRAVGFGLAGAGLLLLVANLEGGLEFISSRGWGPPGWWGWVGIAGMEQPHPTPGWLPTEAGWWWRASRVIATVQGGKALDYTINEFPFFSFLLGDLHPHLMGLPLNLLGLSVGLNLFFARPGTALSWGRSYPAGFLALPLVLGAQGFTNSWELPTFAAFLVACLLFRFGLKRDALALAGVVVLLALLLYLPFYAGFRSPVKLVLPWLGPGSRLFHFFIVWGLFLWLVFPFLLRAVRGAGRREWGIALAVLFFPLSLWLTARLTVSALGGGAVEGVGLAAQRLGLLLPLSLLLLLAVAATLTLRRVGPTAPAFALLLLAFGFILLLGTELFFVLDLFGNRMNSVFKLYYQGWLFISTGSGFALYTLLSRWRWRLAKLAWGAGLALLLAVALYYPAAALVSASGGFSGKPTLNGLAYLYRQQPAQGEALEWLRHRPGNPVVVEAVGESYTAYGRVSAFTGLPTILARPGHQIQYRGSFKPLQGREQDVERIYRSGQPEEVKALLTKYGATYIYFGRLERDRYGEAARSRLRGFLEAPFDNGVVTVFQVR